MCVGGNCPILIVCVYVCVYVCACTRAPTTVTRFNLKTHTNLSSVCVHDSFIYGKIVALLVYANTPRRPKVKCFLGNFIFDPLVVVFRQVLGELRRQLKNQFAESREELRSAFRYTPTEKAEWAPIKRERERDVG